MLNFDMVGRPADIETPPGLWGAYGEYLYLDPHTVLVRRPGAEDR